MNKYRNIALVRKGLSEKNVSLNIEKYGTGALNIDKCRIPYGENSKPYSYPKGAGGIYSKEYQQSSAKAKNWNNFSTVEDNIPSEGHPLGRWPANTIFSSQCVPTVSKQNKVNIESYFKIIKGDTMSEIPQDLLDYLHTMITPTHIGGECLIILEDLNNHDFSQYEDEQWHSCIAQGTPTEEVAEALLRVMKPGAHMMLIAPEEEPTGAVGACVVEDKGFEIRDSIFYARNSDPDNPNFMYMPKASKGERSRGTDKLNLGDHKKGNFHPTVKPVGIMEWCLRDVPKDAVVSDPFMGSGTTGVACLKTGNDFIGIEMDSEYIQIADSRIKYWNTEYRGWRKAEVVSDVSETEDTTKEISIEDLFGF